MRRHQREKGMKMRSLVKKEFVDLKVALVAQCELGRKDELLSQV